MTTLSMKMLPPGSLKPNPWNTNVCSPEAEAKIEASIQRLKMFKPIVVRQLDDGTLQIIGGEHRAAAALRLKMKEVPVMNLGTISDKQAKEIGLVDNGRYGSDDTLQLAELLEGLGSPEDLATFLPYSDADFQSIFSSVTIALDDLDLPSDADTPKPPAASAPQTSVVMRFKVPVEDAAVITEQIEAVIKRQRFTEEDSLSNAGNALVHIFSGLPK